MELVEKKVREFYQEKRREDEKSTPGFDAFWNKLEQAKKTTRPNLVFRVAASVVTVVALLSYYFYSSDRPTSEPGQDNQININQPLPSQSLLDQNLSGKYIWQWKAPTDHLLENARESIKTWKYKKL
jgi:hypothetical protein